MGVKRIVLVDDNSIFCFIFQKLIEKYSNSEVEIKIFDNGKSALDYFMENNGQLDIMPKLIFVDINMPILNGWQLLDSLVAANHPLLASTPFFIVSSSDNDIDIHKSKGYAFVKDYLNKPLDKSRLFSMLDQYLNI